MQSADPSEVLHGHEPACFLGGTGKHSESHSKPTACRISTSAVETYTRVDAEGTAKQRSACLGLTDLQAQGSLEGRETQKVARQAQNVDMSSGTA